MSVTPSFSPSKDESKPSTSQAKPLTSPEHLERVAESQTTHCSDVCFSQQARAPVTLRHATVSRKHNVEETGRQGLIDASRFHPYLRQLSEDSVENTICLHPGSSPFGSLQQLCSPQMCSVTFGSNSEVQTLWEQSTYNGQCSYPDLPPVPAETPCSHSQCYISYNSASPLQEVVTRPYDTEEHSCKPSYSHHSRSSQIHQRNNLQPLFAKPIYSYSILIFMALKNSETGSLPVSEIYSFMTENFPYFKTAPDGWKNSVRHNLSLNKSFEKVEGKKGNSSRKGCLWALNPAKVEKMQEELYKWRRKDPVSVRRSMARPEDLDHLLGQMPKTLRSAPPYTRPAGIYGPMPTSSNPTHGQPSRARRRPQYSCPPPPSQQPSFLTDTHFSDSLALCSPCDQQHTTDVHPESMNLIATMKLPPAYSIIHQNDFNVGLRSLQDLQLEGDTYDVDVLNPSLTDLQLKGDMWEELQEDSLVSHPQSAPMTVTITPGLQASCIHPSYGDTMMLPVSEISPLARHKIEFDDTSSEQSLKQHACSSGWHPDVYSTDNLPLYLTCCTTSLV
ncbi:forkhead box protein N1 isoform X1 [Syngnathus typhle]|uniref:forkhead box protein N1 isoform X1 n=1 Tax=Syngnathus typhle TaxID=161592 RepID=UPI002A6B7F8B|nr:forkhead box protein N1 isoform X1 [Syngnathus typhle]